MQQHKPLAQDTRFSIVIPALHEEASINAVVEALRRQVGIERAEILVVDGDIAASTLRAIADPSVIRLTSDRSRARQMNRGAFEARGTILIFLHADTQLPHRALPLIEAALRDGRYVGGAFGLAIASSRPLLKVIARTANLRSRVTRVPYGDQAIFIRRDYFQGLGCFREIPIMEEVDLLRRIRRRGDRICILAERVLTSARRWEAEGPIYTTLRNQLLVLLFGLGVKPEKLVKLYRSPGT